jgi:hypothetical protein
MVTRAFEIFPVDEVWVQHAAANAMAQSLPVTLGFSRKLDAADYGEQPDKCIWSVCRESWCPNRQLDSVELPELKKVDNFVDGSVA